MNRVSKHNIISTIIFLFLCFIDQRIKTSSGLDGWNETFRDLTGVCMAVLIASHYKLEDFKKWKLPYIIWTVFWMICLIPSFLWGKANRPFLNDWIVILIDIILFGYIVIHTLIRVVVERMPGTPGLSDDEGQRKSGTLTGNAAEKKCFKSEKILPVLWVAMMLFMIFSRNHSLWPAAYLVMFGCFYLSELTVEDRRSLFQGILNGIILFFLIAQAYCCVFRPYDVVRYIGIYSNPNINALFYLEVLSAMFAKLLTVYRKGAKTCWKIIYWLGAGSVMGLLFMTIGRTAWLVAAILSVIFLLSLKRVQGKFLRNGLVLVLCSALMFPVCFGFVRYAPPVFHHPVWFWGEWNEEKVHSWDDWDSEKYVDMPELMDEALGRIIKTAEDFLEHSPFAIKTHAAESNLSEAEPVYSGETASIGSKEEAETDPREATAVLTYEEGLDGVLVRKTIYQYYASHLNLWGHPYEEQGFQLTPTYWIGHAHNIYLQYGTDFGIPVLIIFIVLNICSGIRLWKGFRTQNEASSMGYGLFMLVPLLFGMLEYSWGVGSITIFLLFIAWGEAWNQGH